MCRSAQPCWNKAACPRHHRRVLACLGTQPGTAPWGWGGGAGGCPFGDSHGWHLCPHGDTLRHAARWPLGTGGAEPTLPPCCLTLPLPVPPYQHLRGGTTDSERSRVMHAPCAGWHCRGARCQPPPHGGDLLPAALLLPRAGSVPPQNPQNPAGGSILPRKVCVFGETEARRKGWGQGRLLRQDPGVLAPGTDPRAATRSRDEGDTPRPPAPSLRPPTPAGRAPGSLPQPRGARDGTGLGLGVEGPLAACERHSKTPSLLLRGPPGER